MEELLPNISSWINENLQSLVFFVPEVILTLAFLWVCITDLILHGRSQKFVRNVTAIAFLVVLFSSFKQYAIAADGNNLFFHGMLMLHRPAVAFKVMFSFFSLILTLYARHDSSFYPHKKGTNDFFTLLLGFNLGLHLMAMSVNLLMIYLSIEIVSITSYLFTTYISGDKAKAEAGMKYVLFGATASAVMLYGLSFFYVFTGSLNLFDEAFLTGLSTIPLPFLALTGLLVFVGIAFKLSLVPMHFWVPDVYEGTSTPVTALLSALPKVAGFALLLNILTLLLIQFSGVLQTLVLPFFSVVSIITLIAGNFAAIWQRKVKRLLAYSAIGHSGFALMALLAFNQQGISALLFYLFVYGVGSLAAFILVTYFEEHTGSLFIEDYRGMGKKLPLASVCFVLVLISLIGIPLSGGFTGKFLVFSALFDAYSTTKNVWLMALMITGVITTVVALFYYLQIPLNLFLRKNEAEIKSKPSSPMLISLVVFLTVILVLAGIFPQYIQQFL